MSATATDPFQLKSLSALITGGGSGIGKATALEFAKAGAERIAVSGRNQDKLAATADEIAGVAPQCEVMTIGCDLADAEQRKQLVDQLRGSWDRLDCLVNNAGMFEMTPVADHQDDKSTEQDSVWRQLMAINLEAPYSLSRDLMSLLRHGRNPSIINVSSTLAEKPIPGTAGYNAAKAGLQQMTRTLALECGPMGLRVNAVLPAVVDTPMYADRFPDPAEHQATLQAMAGAHPLGRVGQARDIAYAIRYLASPAASWVSGSCLPVDGGMLVT